MNDRPVAFQPLPPLAEDVRPDVRVAFILSPQFTVLPFAGFIDALRHAADEADWSRQIYCRWSCVGPDLRPVRSSCGIEVRPWEEYADPSAFDYIVVVGGLLGGLRHVQPATLEYLRLAAASRVALVGLCTGSFTLAEAGLMDGRRCAVHWRHRQDLIDHYPHVIPVSEEIYVIDNDRITCPGGTAAIDLAVELLIRHCGRARALKGLAEMVVDKHRGAHCEVRRLYDDIEECGDWRVKRAIELMRQNLREPYSIDCLAERVGTSVRQLERTFARYASRPPTVVWRELRLDHGRWRLLNTTRTITQIADECGFSDPSYFARCFKQTFGEAPYAYRQRRYRVDLS